MTLTEIMFWNAIAILGAATFVWLISVSIKDVSVVDICWGLGFVMVAWLTFLLSQGDRASAPFSPSRWLLPILTTVWGCRLSGYLAWRNHGKPEDKRYAAMRQKRPKSFWWKSLFIVFLLQAVIMWVVSLPLQAGIEKAEARWTFWHFIGIAIWAVGIFFEAVGDWQLARFKRRNEESNKLMDQGLWRYTRHPNYFGDFCVWWGMYLIAVAHGEALWTAIGPALMSLLLMKFSGVGLLEKSLTDEKPEYREYIRRTSPFFPWFSKSTDS